MKPTKVLFRLAAFAMATSSVAAQSPTPEIRGRIDSLTRSFMTEAPAAGMVVAIVKGRDTILFTAYGEQDRANHVAMARDAVFRVGSITKQFTAAAIMQHVEDGSLRLTDTLGTLLPQYPQWAHVTVRQLLNHTSGIPPYTSRRAFGQASLVHQTPAQLMALVESDTADFAPGSAFRYNNSGYILLGMILEKVEGKQYADIVNDRFFKPLRMTSAQYCPNEPRMPHDAVGTQGRDLQPSARVDMSTPFSAGALCMSVRDYLAWQTAITSGRVVSPASFAAMTRSDSLATGAPTGYGFGYFAGVLGGHAMVQHGGDVNGFSTAQAWFPNDSLRVVVFTNTLGSNPTVLALNLASALFGTPLMQRPAALPAAIALSVAELSKYEATYDLVLPSGTVLPLRMFIEGDALVAQAQGQPKLPLRPLGDNVFGVAFDGNLRMTVLFENGRAARLRLLQGGTTIEGPRRP